MHKGNSIKFSNLSFPSIIPLADYLHHIRRSVTAKKRDPLAGKSLPDYESSGKILYIRAMPL